MSEGERMGPPVAAAEPAPEPRAGAAAAELSASVAHAARIPGVNALLVATGLLRVATVGTGVALQFDISDLAHGRPNYLAVGLVGAAQAVTEMLFSPFLARLADRHGRTRFLVAGPLVGLLGALLVAGAISAVQLGAARLIEGVGAAAFVPVALGTIAAATTHNRHVRANASGAFEAATLGGYAGGFFLGSFLWVALHRVSFLVFGLLYVAAALVCVRFVPRLPPLRVSPFSTVLRAVLGPGPLRSFLPAWLCGFALLGAFLANLAAVLRHQREAGQTLMHHFDERVIGLILIGWIAVFVAGIVLWTPVLWRTRPVPVMRRAVPGAWLILGGLLTVNHLPLVLSPLALPLLIGGILCLAGFGPAAVTYLADCSERLAADRAALMSVYTVALAGGGALGSVLGGVAIRLFRADGLIGLGLVLSVITFALLAVVARQEAGQAPVARAG